MTWFKVDDHFHSHPKVMATDPAALGLWVVAGSWCSAGLTNGFVPDYVLPRLLPGAVKLASKLVAAGLWVRAENGYQFHDWLDHNPTAEREKERKANNRRRQQEYRERQKNTDNASRNALRNGGSNGAPSRPGPLPSGERAGGKKSRAKLEVVHTWCGQCDERTRQIELDDGRPARCPRCHHLRTAG
ncbi:hypothetical protein [Amycolatopsis taiwanensis]|uniref:hypothetical protein n=1 Tax=Amycolatopsis taiwanensis TaxID=342230 RepID=UPI000484D5B4|nr:hypothetical protein [Amycolatopsis taiwanensis]